MKAVSKLTFEEAAAELDSVVAQMESGDLALEAALKAYERGQALAQHCQTLLTAAIDLVQIAYKGGGPAMIELQGGQLPMAFISVAAGMPIVQSGRARALGVSSLTRFAPFPELPAIAESGVPGFEFYLWQSITVPAATPRAIVAQLNTELNKALSAPDVKERLLQSGNEIVSGTPTQGDDFIRAEVARWKKIIKPEMKLSR